MTGKRPAHSILVGIVVSALIVVPTGVLSGQEVHPRAGTTSVPLLNLGIVIRGIGIDRPQPAKVGLEALNLIL